MSIPVKCSTCMHRINFYCRAYKLSVHILETDKCKRDKPKPEEIFK